MHFLSGNSTKGGGSSIGLLLIANAIRACKFMWHDVLGLWPNHPLKKLGYGSSHALFLQMLGQMHVQPKPWLKVLPKFVRASLDTNQTSLVNQCSLQKNQCGSEKWNKIDYQLTNNVPSRECIAGVTSSTMKYGDSTRCICWQYNADLISYRR